MNNYIQMKDYNCNTDEGKNSYRSNLSDKELQYRKLSDKSSKLNKGEFTRQE